ncbi:hypothetical protein [Agrobacterium rosae]|uniref:Uncharacterized protein n=1 Tax=Agrobacterium rosae TaxID=1972867 RepID=A0A1R3TG38_9HYPH|nr:hypothetical protein [Agrobacterium rosae]SCX02643.1 hypothetical protein DSM25559_0245 [Agrobacterium rosae]
MTKIPDLTNEITDIADNDWLYLWDASTPANPDAKASGSTLRKAMADLSAAAAVTLADNDRIPVWDVSLSERRYATPALLRSNKAKVTNQFRYDGIITIPALADGAEDVAPITIVGVAVGDHVVFNPKDALPANLGIMAVRVSTGDTVGSVQEFRW